MTPEKLAKIRALAEDARGDPAIRAVAQAVLKRYAQPEPKPAFEDVPPFVDPRVEGMRTSAEYDRWRFMDLGSWKRTVNGNPTHVITVKNRTWRIVLFKHKKTPTWGWMKIDTIRGGDPEFSGKFTTMAAAHGDAWKTLTGT